MAILLISYTIYNDTAFAIASVMSQLYILELKPGTLEISLYALAATVSGAIGSLAFFWIRPLLPFRLEHWLLVCYVIMILIPAWGIIGFADVNFGFKVSRLVCVGASQKGHCLQCANVLPFRSQARWEFYVSQFFLYLSGTIITTCFRVLFSEMMPPKNEVRWFGLQWVLSCATVSARSAITLFNQILTRFLQTDLDKLRCKRTTPECHSQPPLPARAQSYLHGCRVRH
jgi:MFS-type transporter involved in bile tolerance (Atg22 family)